MFKLPLFPLLGLAITAQLALSSAILDFEGLADGSSVSTQFAGQGVSFTNAIALTAGASLNEFDFPPRSGAGVIGDDLAGLIVDFASPATSVSGYFTYSQSVVLIALDASNVILGSAQSLFQNNTLLAGAVGSSANELISISVGSASIKRLVIQGSTLGGSFTLDDLMVDAPPTSIPETTTFSLVFGIAALALTAKLRRSQIVSAAWLIGAFVMGTSNASGVIIDPPTTNPPSLPSGTPTTLVVSARVVRQANEPAIVANGVNAVRVNQDGTTQVLAVMNDDGTNGDQVASDGIFSATTVLSSAQVVSLRVTVALQGVRSRAQSGITDVPVVGGQTSAQVTVRVFETDFGNAPSYQGPSAGPGVMIFANGLQVGTTNSTGQCAFTLLAGDYELQGRIPGVAVGRTALTVLSGQATTATVLLDREKEVLEDVTLSVDELANSVLPTSAPSVTVRFRKGAVPIAVKAIGAVAITNDDGQFVASIDDRFAVQGDGSIRAVASSLLTLFQAQPRVIRLEASILGQDGLPYFGVIQFYLGRYTLSGKLQPPPSMPTLSVSNLPVNVTVLQSNLQFAVTSDSNGHFSLPGVLPLGLIEIRSQASTQTKFYYGFAQFILDRSRSVSITMLSDVDVLNGVTPFGFGVATQQMQLAPLSIEPVDLSVGSASAMPTAEAGPPRMGPGPLPPWLSGAAKSMGASRNASGAGAGADTVEVSVTAGQQGVPANNFATLTVPKGTKRVTLTYNVFTAEYPQYVLGQSIYNDVWSLKVLVQGTGQSLFDLSRNVNSQLFIQPYWLPAGSTGYLSQEFNVESIAAGADALITVYVSATNIGDSFLATSVLGRLSLTTVVSIDDTTLRPLSVSTNGDGKSVSLPRSGDSNSVQRSFRLKVTRPNDATVERVKVELFAASGNFTIATLVNESPSPNGAVREIDPSTIDVIVTHRSASGLNTDPPPTSSIRYVFTLVVRRGSTVTSSDPKYSEILRPLYRMPRGIARYGQPPDPGLDDWSAQPAYEWINTNSGLLTRVNDISGEHGRNIGHSAHTRGTDIDIFHFFTFPGAVSGTQNYLALQTAVKEAFLGLSGTSVSNVAAWASSMRTGLGNLANNTNVRLLFTNFGDSFTFNEIVNGQMQTVTVSDGWAKELLRTGKVSASGNRVFDFGAGSWAPSDKLRFDQTHVHENHIHITLSY